MFNCDINIVDDLKFRRIHLHLGEINPQGLRRRCKQA